MRASHLEAVPLDSIVAATQQRVDANRRKGAPAMMGNFNGWGGWGMMGWSGGIMMLLFWAAVILLAVWLVRGFVPAAAPESRDTAIETLRRRYAAGEIDATEYEQTRQVLSSEHGNS